MSICFLVGKKNNRLNMRRLREHIHRLHNLHAIPPLVQHRAVPCQCRRIARNIHNPLRVHPDQRINRRPVQSLARRIHNRHIRLNPPLQQLRSAHSRVAADKLRVGDPVADRVLLRILHRRRNNLDADHPLRLPGRAQSNRACTAIHVDHRFFPG